MQGVKHRMMANDPHGDRQRRKVLRAMMLITALGGVQFAALNLYRGLTAAAVIELAFVGYSIALLPVIGRTRYFRRWATAYVIPWTLAMLAILAMPGTSPSVFVWPLLLALVLHLLLGSRLGLALSAISLGGAALLAWLRFGTPATSAGYTVMANFTLAGVLGLALAHVYERSRERNERQLRELAATDTLTGLPNRTTLKSTFQQLKRQADASRQPLSVLLMDLDHFKRINDEHGHAAGDRTLADFAGRLRAELRQDDFLYRLGGEEFLAQLPATDPAEAERLANRLRVAWREQPSGWNESGDAGPSTVSIGVATLGGDGSDLDTLLRCADRRLYLAKEKGRDRVVGSRHE